MLHVVAASMSFMPFIIRVICVYPCLACNSTQVMASEAWRSIFCLFWIASSRHLLHFLLSMLTAMIKVIFVSSPSHSEPGLSGVAIQYLCL